MELKSVHWQLSEWLTRKPDVNEQMRKVCTSIHPNLDCRSAYHDPPSILQEVAELLVEFLENPGADQVRLEKRVAELQALLKQYLSRAHWDKNKINKTALSLYANKFQNILHKFGSNFGLHIRGSTEL